MTALKARAEVVLAPKARRVYRDVKGREGSTIDWLGTWGAIAVGVSLRAVGGETRVIADSNNSPHPEFLADCCEQGFNVG